MIDLYNNENLNVIKKKCNWCFSWIVSFVFSFLTGEAFFIIFSFYKYRILFIVFACLFALLTIFPIIYFIDKKSYYSTLIEEYIAILNSESETIRCKIVSFSNKAMTMNDSTQAYEIFIETGEKQSVIYLSNIFDLDFLNEGKEMTLLVNFGYIRGYQNEN